MLTGGDDAPDGSPRVCPRWRGLGSWVAGGLYVVCCQKPTLFVSVSLVNHLDCVYRDMGLCCCCFQTYPSGNLLLLSSREGQRCGENILWSRPPFLPMTGD